MKQRVPAGVLAENGVSFDERGLEVLLPFGIALCLTSLVWLNLIGSRRGRVLSWMFHPIMLVGGGFITAQQVFTAQFLESAFKRSGDPMFSGIDIKAFVDAALHAFPAWLPYTLGARFALATAGSLLVIIMLAGPDANAYFAKESVQRRRSSADGRS